MEFFEKLKKETEKEKAYLYASPIISKALEGTITKEEYANYLVEAFHHVKHTIPLLMACGSRIPMNKRPVLSAIEEYLEEERGHEEWILDDIENLGGNREEARNSTPNVATELMVSYAYDFINRVNPLGFFGMVFVLEGTSESIAVKAAEKIKETLGLDQNCFSYLTSHGTLDIEHMEFFRKTVNSLTEEKDRQDIIHMAKVMFTLYGNMFREVTNDRLAL